MITAELRVPADLHGMLYADITQHHEWAGYLLCGVSESRGETILLGREWCPVPAAHQIKGTRHGLTWRPEFDVEMLDRAQREGLGCVILHHHPGGAPGLSTTDTATRDSLMPFLSREAPDRPHVFAVMGDGATWGDVYQNGSQAGNLVRTRISGLSVVIWPTKVDQQQPASDARHDRLTLGFGPGALERLRATRVCIVGCGGGGSHVAQQLAYLGAGALTLIDADRVELTNLNRLIGAVPGKSHRSLVDRVLGRGVGDVGQLKVTVLQRMVRSISESTIVEPLAESFPSPATVSAMRDTDVIIACVDRLQVRDDLNRLSKRYLIPLLDVGLEIVPSTSTRGSAIVEAIAGRVTKVLADGPCLRCQGIVDDDKLARERGGLALGYTGPVRLPDPAVVTLNGIVASIATTEVLQLLTGFAGAEAPNCGWVYDGLLGTAERVDKPVHGCPACLTERGAGAI
jgi:molybdopterin/thiamine biosynthesis adenylyltransferase/proteasome lid subunit RPN8/RPN11